MTVTTFRAFDSFAGSHDFHSPDQDNWKGFEIFWMIGSGWFWQEHREMSTVTGPFETSRAALVDADPLNPELTDLVKVAHHG